MKVPFVDLDAQYQSIKGEIDNAIASVISKSTFIGGEVVSNFERDFAQYLGVNHCVGCANGTDAIEIALEAIGVGQGDEVLVPAYTWVSTANAVARQGATPVLVDVQRDYYTIDPDEARKKINQNTKVILPVHLYGLPAPMKEIMDLAEEFDLKVVEDCAQAHGAQVSGQKVGSFGHIATFSFYPGKNLGAYGDAGAIVTSDDQLEEKVRIIARLGQRKKHDHVAVGRNSRLDGLQAAILSAKLKHLDSWTANRQQVAQWYTECLNELNIRLPDVPSGMNHVYHLYVIQTENRDELQAFLKEKGITALIHYPRPLNQLGLFQQDGSFEVANYMASRILSLPIYPEMTRQQVEYVATSIAEYFSS